MSTTNNSKGVDEPQITVPGMKRRNNEIWKKIAEVQNEHQNFLQRLGFVEAQAIQARFIDPGITNDTEMWTEGRGKFMGHGLPWRSFDPTSPKDERQKIFESFNRPEFDLPDSTQALNEEMEPDGPKKSQHPHKHGSHDREKHSHLHNRSPVFRGSKADEKYFHAKAKVDSGLRQRRVGPMKANIAVPKVHGVIHPKSPLYSKAGPLTIASKLPNYVQKVNYAIPSIIMNGQQGTPPGVNYTSKGNIKNYLDSMNVYTAYEQIKREKTQNLNVITNQPGRPGHPGLFTGGSAKPVSYWDYKSNHAKRASANYDKFIDSIMYSGNPVTILKPPPRKRFNIPGLMQPESAQQVMYLRKPTNGQSQNRVRTPEQIQARNSTPTKLPPKHVPGPQYDNIYIGRYSGTESEKETDDEDDRSSRGKMRPRRPRSRRE